VSNSIICLDGFAVNPGDLDWDAFERLGKLQVFARTAAHEVVARARGAQCLLLNKAPLDRDMIAALPKLRYVGVLATGYNTVDIAAARQRGIVVTNVPAYGIDSVAQHVLALMLALLRPIELHDRAVKAGDWTACPDWCFSLAPVHCLGGRTLGIVGLGRIGQAVAHIAQALGMNLLGTGSRRAEIQVPKGLCLTGTDLDTLFATADIISLHCPLTPDTKHLVDHLRLAQMKPGAMVINTSRGDLIDSRALADALHRGHIGGAGLDVLDEEPPSADHPLLQAPNCIITPHIAWYAQSARRHLLAIAADNLAKFLQGQPVNQVQIQ